MCSVGAVLFNWPQESRRRPVETIHAPSAERTIQTTGKKIDSSEANSFSFQHSFDWCSVPVLRSDGAVCDALPTLSCCVSPALDPKPSSALLGTYKVS